MPYVDERIEKQARLEKNMYSEMNYKHGASVLRTTKSNHLKVRFFQAQKTTEPKQIAPNTDATRGLPKRLNERWTHTVSIPSTR